VLHGSGDVDHTEDRVVGDNPDRTERSLGLEMALAVHPINAVVTDSNVRVGPQSDEASGELLFTVGTVEGR